MNKKGKELISEIIESRLEGDTCIETAENYVHDVKKIDKELYTALKRLNDAADDMIHRLQDLNEEHNLGHNSAYI